MRLYLTAAGVYAGTQQEAKADGKGWKLEEVPTAKYELIDYLNALKFRERETAGHLTIEQAESAADIAVTEELMVLPEPKPVGYAKQAVAFEDEFEAMPLSLKLHYAALAMEAARDELGKDPPKDRRSWGPTQEALG